MTSVSRLTMSGRWWVVLAALSLVGLWWYVETSPVTGPTTKAGTATVSVADLPPQAQETLRLIDRGGPFPVRQDGATFTNREHRLPARELGYWRAYTVPTRDVADRGARLLVVGRGSEVYYTSDHGESFRRVRLS